MRLKTIILAAAAFSLIIGIAFAAQNQGPEDIDLDGGNRGNIDFPHHMHQVAIGDCNACHEFFPKAVGSIKDLKDQKKLKQKQIMNDVCIQCHKDKKAAGENTGPTSCSKCHSK